MAIGAAVNERLGFIRRTYVHLLGMLIGVGAVCAIAIKTGIMARFTMPILIVGFIGVIFVVPRLVASRVSRSKQYLGAGICTLFYGLLISPLVQYAPAGVLTNAFVLTCCVFVGLTAYVFTTKKDFSWMRGMLTAGIFLALGIGIISLFFGGFGGTSSMLYSGFIVVLFAGYILYDTSNVLHHYPTDAYVAAAIALMIDFVTMFYYIAMLLMGSRD